MRKTSVSNNLIFTPVWFWLINGKDSDSDIFYIIKLHKAQQIDNFWNMSVLNKIISFYINNKNYKDEELIYMSYAQFFLFYK